MILSFDRGLATSVDRISAARGDQFVPRLIRLFEKKRTMDLVRDLLTPSGLYAHRVQDLQGQPPLDTLGSG